MKIKIAYITHQGKVRKHNEDAIVLLSKVIQVNEMSMPVVKDFEVEQAFFAIADGLGGYKAGEIASRIVLKYLANNWESLNLVDKIYELIQKSHLRLVKYAKKHPKVSNFGTTLAGLWISNLNNIFFNVGDSRVYRINQGYLEQLSKDQSIIQSLIDQGIISEKEARNHPKKNIILESIGGRLTQRKIEIISKEIGIKENDSFIICSDGLTDMLTIDEMEICLEEDLAESVKNLFTNAMIKGGKDNISIILIKIKKL